MSEPNKLISLAKEHGFDGGNFEVMAMLKALLKSIADGPIDSGGGSDSADLWVPIGGVEYFITIRKSNNQLTNDKQQNQGEEI